MSIHPATRHLIKLTTHPSNFGIDPEPLNWGERDPRKRGPVVATVSKPGMRNSIGAHSGTYCVYRAVALAVQAAPPDFRPDFTNTLPPCRIGPFDAWFDVSKIVSLDPWGHVPQDVFADRLANGTLDIRPTIAVTKSHLDLPEIQLAIKVRTPPSARAARHGLCACQLDPLRGGRAAPRRSRRVCALHTSPPLRAAAPATSRAGPPHASHARRTHRRPAAHRVWWFRRRAIAFPRPRRTARSRRTAWSSRRRAAW